MLVVKTADSEQVLQQVRQMAKTLNFNELHIVYWSLALKRLKWHSDQCDDLKVLLACAAHTTKVPLLLTVGRSRAATHWGLHLPTLGPRRRNFPSHVEGMAQ
jgi:hypothetical protein